jgi:chromate reductase
MPHLVVLDGSLRPGTGNTARALDLACAVFAHEASFDRIALAAYRGTVAELAGSLRAADGLLVGSGTYWSSWGSPLQRFFELMTTYEATDVFLGKPAAVIVTMDSTGGSEVAARLVATLACFGCSTPPFGWMALSRVGVRLGEEHPEATRDVFGPADVRVLAENLVVASCAPRVQWRAWDVERVEPSDRAWPAPDDPLQAAPDFLD